MLHTTLTLLRRNNACAPGYKTLISSLPKGHGDDAPIALLHILESNGIKDAIWALRATVEKTGKDMAAELAIRAAERAQITFDKQYPADSRVRECNEATRAYARGDITRDELLQKRDTAATAGDGAATANAAASAYAAVYAAGAASGATAVFAAADLAADACCICCPKTAAIKAEREAQAADYRELLGQF